MDLELLYSNFVMNDQELFLHSTPDGLSVFRDDRGITHCTITSFQHADPDVEKDTLSINHYGGDWTVTGSDICPGSGFDYVYSGRHIAIRPATYGETTLGSGRKPVYHACVPREDLHMSLCNNSLRPTLIADRRVYWTEVTPLRRKWKDVNDSACPHCHKVIRVNMSRHLRAAHTDNKCFWRSPVSTCLLWFSSELNGKDHLERTHIP